MGRGLREIAAVVGMCGSAASAWAGDYWLFKPKPRESMRQMSTDRPDTTESPYTVDAGHFQLEMSLMDFTRDSHNEDGVRSRAWAVAPMLIKAGILENFDLQLGIDPYTHVRETDKTTGDRTTAQGFGDTIVRAKVNLWGNDEGTTALAIMPFVKFPTAADGLGNGKCEGGLILPLAIDLGGDVSLGLMHEFDAVRAGDRDDHTIEWVHTATLGVPLAKELGGYVEYAGFANWNHAEKYRGYFDAGLTYALTENVQLDGGFRIGLTEAADDFGIFAGISFRY